MTIPQKQLMSRRFQGLDLQHPPQDLAEGMCVQSDNLQIIGGTWQTRPGMAGQFNTKLTSGIYSLTSYLTATTATPPVYSTWHVFATGDGQVQIAQKGVATAPTPLLLESYTYSDLSIVTANTHITSLMRPFVASDVGKVLTVSTNIFFTYTDLVIGATTTHVSSVTRPFLSTDVNDQLVITGGTGFSAGTYTINSVTAGVAVLSSSAGTTGSVGGNAQLEDGFTPGTYTISSVSAGVAVVSSPIGVVGAIDGEGSIPSVAFNLNAPNTYMWQLGKFLYVVDGQSGLFRIYVPGTNPTTAYVAIQVTNADTPQPPSGAVVSGVLADNMQTAWTPTSTAPLVLNWNRTGSFPPILGGSSSVPGAVSNPEFAGASATDTDPPPFGWQTGGDSCDFVGGALIWDVYMDEGGPSWVDWETMNPGYTPGTSFFDRARVFNVTFSSAATGGNAVPVIVSVIPETSQNPAGNANGTTAVTDITDLAINSGTLSTVTSSADPFSSVDVGRILTITGGPGWVTGMYVISAVSGAVATLQMSGATGLETAVCALYGTAEQGLATLSANPVVIFDLECSGGSNSHVKSAALYTFAAGDVGKILTVVSTTPWEGGTYLASQTITAVASGVATLTGQISSTTSATGGLAFLGLDNSTTAWGAQNYALESPPSAVTGGGQAVTITIPAAGTLLTSQVFSFTSLTTDPDFVRLRILGPPVNKETTGNVQMQVVDVGMLIDTENSTAQTVHLKAKPGVSGTNAGANCLGGSFIVRDYTSPSTQFSYTDLVVGSGANTNQVSSATRPFLFSDVNRSLNITGGTNFTIAAYYITAVSASGVATVNTAVGTAAATGGVATLTNAYDFSLTSQLAFGYSAPATSGQIPFRLGFLEVGQPLSAVAWTGGVTYTTDGTSFFVDITPAPSSVRKQTAKLFIQVTQDIGSLDNPTLNPADVCTIGPLTSAGNLTIGGSFYNYVITEVDDTTVSATGTPTLDAVDGQIETDPSQPSLNLNPTGIAAQATMTMPTPENDDSNYYYVYRYGGVFPNSDTVPTYRLIAQLPLWTNTLAYPYSLYCTWNYQTRVFIDSTPDSAIFLATTLAIGRDALAGLTPQQVCGWQNRVCVATETQLNLSWLVTWNEAAGLYFNSINTPDDPYGTIKGIQISVGGNDNDNIQALVPFGPTLIIFKERSIWQLTGTDATNFELSGHLTSAGIGLVAPRAWVLMQNPVLPIQNTLWFLAADGVWEYDSGDAAHTTSQIIEPLINPVLGAGLPIPASYYTGAAAIYHDRKFMLFIATPPFSYVDLEVQTTNTTVWSSSRPFLTTDVGKTLTITGGSGWTTGTYTITAVSQGIATLNNSPASALTQFGYGSLPADTVSTVCYVYDTRYQGWTRYILGSWSGAAQVGITSASSLIHSSDTNDLYMASTDGQIYQFVGNGDYATPGSSVAAVPFDFRARGMGQEQEGMEYWAENRVTRIYVNMDTQESYTATFGVEADTSFPYRLAYTVDGPLAERLKVPSDIRGRVVIPNIHGSSVTPTTITAIAIEAAEGRLRGH